jgi:hypothetical protein
MVPSGTLVAVLRDLVIHGIATQVAQSAGLQKSNRGARDSSTLSSVVIRDRTDAEMFHFNNNKRQAMRH